MRNLNIHRSMGPSEIYPRILRELADVVTKPLSMIFEKSWQLGEVPGDWKNVTSDPLLKRVKKMTLITTNLSVSPL